MLLPSALTTSVLPSESVVVVLPSAFLLDCVLVAVLFPLQFQPSAFPGAGTLAECTSWQSEWIVGSHCAAKAAADTVCSGAAAGVDVFVGLGEPSSFVGLALFFGLGVAGCLDVGLTD
jgi:hypothetical protein